MNDGVVLIVDVDRVAPRAPRPRALPRRVDEQPRRRRRARARRQGRAPAALGRARGQLRLRAAGAAAPRHRRRHRHRPDLGARPARVPAARRHRSRSGTTTPSATPSGFTDARPRVDGAPRRGDGRLHGRRRRGLRLRQLDPRARPSSAATRAPGSSPASCRPTSGRSSARARARSAGPRSPATPPTSPRPTRPCSSSSPTTSRSTAGSRRPRRRSRSRGCPRASAGSATASATWPALRFNEMVADGTHHGAHRHRPRPPRLRQRRVARTARPRRCSTAPTPSPTGRCSTRSSTPRPARRGSRIHHGGGVGIGRSIHAGQVTVADGTALAAEKIERVLTNDPGMGVIRHVDAGYDRAVEVAEERGVRIPMREGDARRERRAEARE